MARPKGSKNKPKDDTPVGSKENPHKTPTTNVTEGLFLVHCRKIADLEKKKDEAVAALRAGRKAAKGDGIDLKTFDAVRHLAKQTENEIAHGFNTLVAYARWMKTPVYHQMALFEVGEVNEDSVAAKAKERGEADGRLGKGQEACPYDPTSEAGRRWLDGYHEGQAALMQGFEQLGGAQ